PGPPGRRLPPPFRLHRRRLRPPPARRPGLSPPGRLRRAPGRCRPPRRLCRPEPLHPHLQAPHRLHPRGLPENDGPGRGPFQKLNPVQDGSSPAAEDGERRPGDVPGHRGAPCHEGERPMARTGWLRWALAAALALGAAGGQAQIILKKDQPPLPIDEAVCNAVIDKALKALEEEYVFPEMAAKMARAVRQRQADKEYAKVKTGQELAALLTKHLQEVSRDKHLRVSCSTEKLPKRPEGKGPTPRMKERMRQMMLKTNAGYRKVERLGGNVGYLAVDGFADAEAAAGPAAAAMNFLANTEALIIDLRRNGGGNPHGVALLCSYFFDEKPVHLNDLYWRKGHRTQEFWTSK